MKDVVKRITETSLLLSFLFLMTGCWGFTSRNVYVQCEYPALKKYELSKKEVTVSPTIEGNTVILTKEEFINLVTAYKKNKAQLENCNNQVELYNAIVKERIKE